MTAKLNGKQVRTSRGPATGRIGNWLRAATGVDPALGDGTSRSMRPRTSTVGAVPTTYRPRRAPCTHCGDTVLIVEAQIGSLFGMKLRGVAPKVRLEHADPGPVDDVFDAVDDGCRRPPVTR